MPKKSAAKKKTATKSRTTHTQSGGVAIRSRKSTHITGNVVGRDNITYNITKVIQMAAFTPPPDLKKLRKDYLEHLRRSHRMIG